jgi:hypothetical protein
VFVVGGLASFADEADCDCYAEDGEQLCRALGRHRYDKRADRESVPLPDGEAGGDGGGPLFEDPLWVEDPTRYGDFV